jgi:cyanophycinase-like exopeptidase
MSGPVGLLGGLEHLDPTLPFDRELLDLVGAASPRVVVLPVASPSTRMAVAAGALAMDQWARLGVRAQIAVPASSSDPRIIELVASADVIVLPGGVPNRLVRRLRGTRLWEEIVDRWVAGAGVTGSSAGAIGLFQRRLNLYPPNPFSLIDGLGMLGGFVAAPHFDRFKALSWSTPIVKRYTDLGVIGLDESTGLVGENGAWRVLGPGSVTVAVGTQRDIYRHGAITDLDMSTTQNRESVSVETGRHTTFGLENPWNPSVA